MKTRRIEIILGIVLALVAVGAIPAGLAMIQKPDGSILHMPTDILQGSPFNDFLIPGIFLFGFNGLGSLAGAVLCFIHSRYSAISGLILGIGLVVWIIVQLLTTGLISWMQPAYFTIGLVEIILGLLIIRRIRTH
jgi:ABC-type proline/glycine betaine transport system permease subunit